MFFGLSAYVLTTRKDMSFLSGFITAGFFVLLGAVLVSLFFQISGLQLAISAGFVLFSSAMILYQTSAIIHGGERNYIMATISLYVSIYNLFISLLQIFGIAGGDDDKRLRKSPSPRRAFHLQTGKTQALVYHSKKSLRVSQHEIRHRPIRPSPLPAARRALRFSEAALAGGHEIVRLFFYQDGVHSASANVVSGQDEFDLPAAWRELVERNGLDAVVHRRRPAPRAGAEEAERYGRPGANLGAPWELSGLGQLHEAAQTADRLVCFGGDR